MTRIFRHSAVCALAGFLVLAPLTGCLFEPRTPEAPSTVSVQYLPKTSPSNAWANLERSLINTHAFGWEDNIVPEGNDFIYLPDTNADEQFPGIFATWDRAKEVNFIGNLYDSGVSITAKLRNDEFIVPDPSGTVVVWEGVVYDLTVKTGDSSIRYRGRAIITFRLVANFWYIAKWEDQFGESNPDNEGQILPTMGVLRGTFGSK
ncbi:hypothetical protein GW813_01300 [bacterium]|nr:hypothetical protein [bacterium]PIV81035.1 MAG: hypothetical protein COW53_06550 [bacterium CG17_big_fil_post_rev_8_21_14_2_50_64_8]PJA73713.1 MAG: hypothetical protein CO151_12415 [bacterium CG_4_9_14_3_um_filter_65_15]